MSARPAPPRPRYNGTDTVAPCPRFTFARTMEDSVNCNLCGNCIKSCPNDAITLSVRRPTKKLWFLRNPKVEESFLAMAIMGIVLIQNVTMLQLWTGSPASPTAPVIITAVFAGGVSVPVALLALAAKVAARGNLEGTLKNFARFGYALIPLDVAARIAHNLFHLLAVGKSVFYTPSVQLRSRLRAVSRFRCHPHDGFVNEGVIPSRRSSCRGGPVRRGLAWAGTEDPES